MKKHLILALAVAGLTGTTACGSKSSYRAIPEIMNPKKVTPPDPVDPSVEDPAFTILNKDVQFKSTIATQQTLTLQQEIKAVSMKIEITREGQGFSQMQASVSLMTNKNDESCEPTEKKSAEFNKADLGKKEIKIEELGRVTCVDQNCDNAILIVEKKGDSFSEQQSTVFGAVAILMSRDKTTGTFESATTQSDLFLNLDEKVDERVAQCLKDKEENPGKESKEQRIKEIKVELKKIDTEIELHKQGKIISNLNTIGLRIAELTEKKKKLEAELAQLQENHGSATESGIDTVALNAKLARIKKIDDRIAEISKQVELLKQGKVTTNVDSIAIQVTQLEREKASLVSEKAGISLNL